MLKFQFWPRIILMVLFGIYLMCVALLCFTPSLPLPVQLGSYPTLSSIMVGRAEVVYMPFQEILTEGFWLNVIMTMPMGAFIYLLFRRVNLLKQILTIGLLTGLTIETGQFILDNLFDFHRTVDINDVISNWFGVMIAYYGLKLLKWGWQRLTTNKSFKF
ncbi:VanZ family protein [Lactobacillaceae bacterium Scapto_B20]